MFSTRTLVTATSIALALGCACGPSAAKDKVSKHTPKAAEAKPLEPASADQVQAAERAYYGTYACEFNQTVDVVANPKAPGYVDVKFKNKVFVMKPVLSSTGALRLEDVTGRTLMIQIATKSMLLDVKAGQRLVDECVHPEHQKPKAA